MDWTFLLTLLWCNNILQIMNSSGHLLQAKDNDLFIVLYCFKLSITKLQELRTDDRFVKFVKEAKEL